MKPAYISSASIVSPQQHFEDEGFLNEVHGTDNGMLFIKEPNYRKYINPVAIRRMSKLLKMGISTGMNALEQAGVEKPDAIITGTGRGSMVDMEQFLLNMIKQEEEALTPTAFIQSTYNSVNGWLALQTKSNGYNQTYVNRGTSLELALTDAQMLLNETEAPQHLLVGCFDEITPDYVRVKGKVDYWKKPVPPSLELLKHADTEGTIAGEGAAFFALTNDVSRAICSINTISTLQDATPGEVLSTVEEVLSNNGLASDDVDVLLTGMNGDSKHQPVYDTVQQAFGYKTTVAAFKHLCGEYDTATGFALWVATQLFKSQNIPEILTINKGTNTGIKNILLVNHYILNSTSVVLLQISQ